MKNIGFKIRKIRELKNYTQAYMADQLGIARESYGRLENGESAMKLDVLEQIANVFQVKIEDIINLDTNTVYYHINNNSGTNIGINHIDKMNDSGTLLDIIKNYQEQINENNIIIKKQQELIERQELLLIKFENKKI